MSKIREAIINAIRSVPGLTVAEISASDIDLSSITVGELGGAVRFSAIEYSNKFTFRVGQDPGVSTLLKSERIGFDKTILVLISDSEIALDSETIAASYKCGHGATPTPDQLRKSLGRSIKAGLVKRTGKARGTRYTLTAKGRKVAS